MWALWIFIEIISVFNAGTLELLVDKNNVFALEKVSHEQADTKTDRITKK